LDRKLDLDVLQEPGKLEVSLSNQIALWIIFSCRKSRELILQQMPIDSLSAQHDSQDFLLPALWQTPLHLFCAKY